MTRNILTLVLGIVALSGLGVAHAAVVTLPTSPTGPSLNIGDIGIVPVTYQSGSFTDNFYFSLASTSKVDSGVTAVVLAGFGFSSLAAELINTTTSTVVGSGLNITLPSLTGGDNYDLRVSGTPLAPLGGLFGGAVHVSSVPVPAAAWLLISGLAGIGALARRRKTEVVS